MDQHIQTVGDSARILIRGSCP